MPQSPRRRSDPGLDLHRGLAVVLMFLAHAWRMQDGRAPSGALRWLDDTLAWMDRGVAYVAASFLFIAGFSLVLARRDAASRTSGAFFVGVARRAGWLYAMSLLMFLAEHGTDLPDVVASSGILSVIAVAVTTTAAAVVSARPNLALAALAAVVMAATYALEAMGLSVSGLNAGPGGAIPLVAFSAVGALTARLYLIHGVKAVASVAAIASPGFVIALAQDDRWLALYTSVYRDHGGLAIAHFLGLTSPGPGTVSRVFWNPSTMGAVGLLAPVALTTTLLLAVQNRIASWLALRPLLLLGRHALTVFVAHYAMLGVADLAGLRPPHGAWTLLLVAALVVACTGLSAIAERWPKRVRHVK
jgi:uncharacterized membrane protein